MAMTKLKHLDDPGFTAIARELHRWFKEMPALSDVSAPGAERSKNGSKLGNSIKHSVRK